MVGFRNMPYITRTEHREGWVLAVWDYAGGELFTQYARIAVLTGRHGGVLQRVYFVGRSEVEDGVSFDGTEEERLNMCKSH